MSYISAYHDKYNDKVKVWERNKDGKRVYKEYNTPYYFYVEDKLGDFEGLTGETLKKLTFECKEDFDLACRQYKNKFESDLGAVEKVLMDNYYGADVPTLVFGFVDIETDYQPEKSFSGPKNPYAPINAITLYRSDITDYITLALPPESWNNQKLPDDLKDVILFDNEKDLLRSFIDIIEEVDIISGWNSEFFDIPYIAKRIELLFGKTGVKKLGFSGGPEPKWTETEKFKGSGDTELTLEIKSRVHLDYMKLFKKFNLEGRGSYALASIADAELDVPKMHYDGTLHQLYNNDFITFLRYNRRDTEILVKLEEKFKYIQLANTMVHEATVNFASVFGSVQLIDTAIINYSRHVLKKIVYDRRQKPHNKVEGALVMTPTPGFYKWVFTLDINSLYPSVYRSLNLSPEMIIGQFTGYEDDWKTIYKANTGSLDDQQKKLTLVIESNNETMTQTAEFFIEFFKSKKMAVSGYGTVLDQSRGEGLLPSILSTWFKGRKQLQAKKKEFAKLAKDRLEEVKDKTDSLYLEYRKSEEYYDMLQGVRKVLLNSTYGATLSEYCRFADPRLGASTTGSGRQISTEMSEFVTSVINGHNKHKIVKTITYDKDGNLINDYKIDCEKGKGSIYGDTDSVFASIDQLVDKNLSFTEQSDFVINYADDLCKAVNVNFDKFMKDAFLCTDGFDNIIRANREVVSSATILQAKKKYVMNVVNLEGTHITEDNPKSIKTMGSDIKLTSTPIQIRGFIKDVTLSILREKDKKEIEKYILNFRKTINSNKDFNVMDFATISSVNKYDEYYQKFIIQEKNGMGRANLPGNARASINYNEMLDYFNDKESPRIKGGSKIKIVWLKKNEFKFDSIAFSSEQEHLPQWFLENFEVDMTLTEKKMIDKKLENILGAIGWEVPTPQTVLRNSLLDF